jgi:hypothetical protein
MWLRTWLFDNLREVSRLMAFEEGVRKAIVLLFERARCPG